MKNILFMVLSFSIFLLFSCSDKEENEPFIPVDEIISAKTFLIPNKDTKVVSTILNFKNIDAIDYLMVRKSGGNSYSVKIDRNELTADYVFNYVVQKTDPQNFRLILVAVYKDGNKSNDLSLNVDNRIWEMQPGKYGIFFGDTFGYDFKPNPANPGPNGGSW